MAALTACGRGGPTATTDQGGRPGEVGVSFNVTVFRPKSGGTVSTGDRKIDCGPAATADKCFATYAWNEMATIIATPADGFMFGGWAGDCFTRGEVDGVYTCVLSTATSQGGTGADKYVVAVFGEPGLTLHPNFTPATGPDGKYLQGVTTTHGPEFLKWIDIARDGTPNLVAYFDCGACHGANFDGLGIAPSCNDCHAKNGHPNWRNECDFCHGSPPGATARPLSPSSNHPPVSGGATACASCHSDTVDGATGLTRNWSATTPTNAHMNGKVDGGGHAPGFNDPSVHSAAFFETIKANGSPAGCTQCHGPTYETVVPTLSAGNQSCTTCHGGPAWLTTCDFCHGSPPPRMVNNTAPGATHPATGAMVCANCHPATVNSGGTIVGNHMNGLVEVEAHDAGFAAVTVHGPEFLTAAGASAGGTNTCQTCHAVDYSIDMGGGKSCNECHATAIAAWDVAATSTTNWQSNCTFCHGTRTPAFTSADLALSGPPDDIAQRLDPAGVERLERTGQHSIHLFDNGIVPIGAGDGLPCSTCHAVPPTIEAAGHITADLRAPVAMTPAGAFPGLSGTDLAKLPNPLVTYDRTAGTCTGYCHGSAAWGGNNTAMTWADDFSTPIQGCNDCHGQPPPTGTQVKTALTTLCPLSSNPNGCNNHLYHSRINRTPYLYDSCANCHFGSANGQNNGLHVNGKADIVFTPSGTPGYKAFTATWDPATKTCTASCHTVSGTGVIQAW